jgi:LmbE family N-acetylglucosaminyl deacetylase
MGSLAAIAIAAHPDDIEFYMAGTLLLLRQAGYETHYLNLASGNCGSSEQGSVRTRSRRRREAKRAATRLGAVFHPGFTDDLEILYELPLLRRVAGVIREVRPRIVLTHSPQDYMEDHTTAARLAVTAAFARGMPNFQTVPRLRAISAELAVYHGMPHGLRDPLRRRIVPGVFVNTTQVHARKREALGCHESQKDWLDHSQGLGSYLRAMDDMSRELGRISGRFEHCEGWRRHLHLGFSASEIDPLADALCNECLINPGYERDLESTSHVTKT